MRLRAASIGSLANNSSACSFVLGKPINAQTELLLIHVNMCHILTKNDLVSIVVFTDGILGAVKSPHKTPKN